MPQTENRDWLLLVSFASLLLPIVAQAFVTTWWLKRQMARMTATDSGNWLKIVTRAILFGLIFGVAEYALAWILIALAHYTGNSLGYAGFGLIALALAYGGAGLIVGVVIATFLWLNGTSTLRRAVLTLVSRRGAGWLLRWRGRWA